MEGKEREVCVDNTADQTRLGVHPLSSGVYMYM